jgi:hypothetical protein
MELEQNSNDTNIQQSFLDTLPENAVYHLVHTAGVKRYQELNNLESFDPKSVSNEELKKYVKEEDVIEYQKQNLEKNNKLFEEYGLSSLKYDDLVDENVEPNDDNKEFYHKLWLSHKEKGLYLPYFEKLIDTHKERKMKFVGNTVIPNEIEMKEMRQRIEQMMKQYQQQQQQQQQQQKQQQQKPEPEIKNKALHKSLQKLNDSKESRLTRMRAKLNQRKESASDSK